MTEKQIIRFIKYLKRKKSLTRKQIHKHFHDIETAKICINQLSALGYMKMISDPEFSSGNFVEKDEDIFSLDIAAHNHLNDLKDDFFLHKVPILISILALTKSYNIGIDDIILWCMQQLKL